ncbi:hypothetical protein J6590_040583 [Homalodisca vitripennis]|nr:hypothetical protein J6590_040583 [Homalodisca vitripennis]
MRQSGESYAATVRRLRGILGRNEAPYESTVRRLVKKFQETGSTVDLKSSGLRRCARTEQNIEVHSGGSRSIMGILQSSIANLGTTACFVRRLDPGDQLSHVDEVTSEAKMNTMESSVTEENNGLPLHLFPIDVIEMITQYLSAKDLAACCASSRKMREVFGDDILWRRYCDRELAEYLRTTPCRVEPPFVSPETEANTICPLSYWRMAFMRENHLWNNYSQGKYKEEKMTIVNRQNHLSTKSSHMFFSNDVMLIRVFDRIHILDAVDKLHVFLLRVPQYLSEAQDRPKKVFLIWTDIVQ